MPKAGVGITRLHHNQLYILQFQSIYAQSGRWNYQMMLILIWHLFVSIHLCTKRALELEPEPPNPSKHVCFNPFMPKAGVGILFISFYVPYKSKFQSIYAQSGRWNVMSAPNCACNIFVSIHLCPKRALEYPMQRLVYP